MLCAISGPSRGLPTHIDLSTRTILGHHPTQVMVVATNEDLPYVTVRMNAKEARFRVPPLLPRRFPSLNIVLRPLERTYTETVQDTFPATASPSLLQRHTLEGVLSFGRVPTRNPNLDRRHDRLGVRGPVSPNSTKSLLFPSRRSNQCRRRHLPVPRMGCRYQAMTKVLH